MEKQGLNLYYIDDNYITFLKNSGNKSVENNYANADNQKPYIGVVLKVNENNYFAPIVTQQNEKGSYNILKNCSLGDDIVTQQNKKGSYNKQLALSLNDVRKILRSKITLSKTVEIKSAFFNSS